tara:strand:- start:72 stop:581 length:510 start_codon:yes stop_codon:yes gene_type:complete
MKITKTRLKKIIKEELDIVLKEYLTMEDAPRYFAGQAIGALKTGRVMSRRFGAIDITASPWNPNSELFKIRKEVGGDARDYCRALGKEIYKIVNQMSTAMAYKSGADFADFEPRLKEVGKSLISASNQMVPPYRGPPSWPEQFKEAVDQLSPEIDDLIKTGYEIIEANS